MRETKPCWSVLNGTFSLHCKSVDSGQTLEIFGRHVGFFKAVGSWREEPISTKGVFQGEMKEGDCSPMHVKLWAVHTE